MLRRALLPVFSLGVLLGALLGACDGCENGSQPAAPAAAAALGACPPGKQGKPGDGYDPLAFASADTSTLDNPEAVIPPQCYTRTAGVSNPCWTCHTQGVPPNDQHDHDLQREYALSDVGMTNYWTGLFVDRSAEREQISDADILAWIRKDNYTPLRAALARREDFPGYRADLDFTRGFDEEGFARDGSGWRAFRYKPFPGTFWPTNGSTDDVLIRLPVAFRKGESPDRARALYKVNLAILEANMASDPALPRARVRWPTEPLDEVVAGVDLDGDGAQGTAVELLGLPAHYLGAARETPVVRGLYPRGVEFLHSVRYIDPDKPNLIATRMKELRYSRKLRHLDTWALKRAYELERNEKQDENALPRFGGAPDVGLVNSFGWQLQGFIEDADGRLRLQTIQEHYFCMGCHSNIGVTADQTFSLPRKVPGKAGWGYQDVAGIPDVPQRGHDEPEILTYFERVGGGDEFRANDEILARFFPGGTLDAKEVRRAAPGGDRDIRHLIAPSRRRALELDKAYYVVVRHQGPEGFARGRDAVLSPPVNVHRKIEQASTGLTGKDKIFRDGRLRLAWQAGQAGQAGQQGKATAPPPSRP